MRSICEKSAGWAISPLWIGSEASVAGVRAPVRGARLLQGRCSVLTRGCLVQRLVGGGTEAADALPVADDTRDLIVAQKGALDAFELAGVRRHEEHVAAPSSRSAPGTSRITRLSTWLLTANAMRAGKVGLDQAGDDVDRRPLRGDDQVDANGARHLRQPADVLLHLLRRCHHQVGHLVDDDHDVGQLLFVALLQICVVACRYRVRSAWLKSW